VLGSGIGLDGDSGGDDPGAQHEVATEGVRVSGSSEIVGSAEADAVEDDCASIDAGASGPLQPRIANTTIMVIEFQQWSGQSFDIAGGARRAAESS
jgi:hypothetical protein